jgi:hypothetical protein
MTALNFGTYFVSSTFYSNISAEIVPNIFTFFFSTTAVAGET